MYTHSKDTYFNGRTNKYLFPAQTPARLTARGGFVVFGKNEEGNHLPQSNIPKDTYPHGRENKYLLCTAHVILFLYERAGEKS